MVIYLNYYLLFPKFYTQHKYNLYWCLSVLSVVMKESKSEENPLVFAICSSYTDIINTHQSYLNYTQEAASTEKEDSESKSTRQLEKIEIVYRYIKTHRFCSVKEISDACHIPYSSVTRYLALLKNSKRIKYKGSRKTGGYIVR